MENVIGIEEEKVDEELIPTQCYIAFPIAGDWQGVDLARYGIQMYPITDGRFKALEDIGIVEQVDTLRTIIGFGQDYQEHCYVITHDNSYDDDFLAKFFHFLLLIRPSKLTQPFVHFQIEYHRQEGIKEIFRAGKWTIAAPINIHEMIRGPLTINEGEIESFQFLFDNFLKKQNDKNEEFLRIYSIYLAAVKNRDPFIKFILLMIVVECLISGKTEVTYKIRRVCSVLIGANSQVSETVYKNMGTLYDDRSNFVHNGLLEDLTLDKIDYLHHLVCVVMATLLLGEIPLSTLVEKTNKYGFGQRKALLLAEYEIKDDRLFTQVARRLVDVLPKKAEKEQPKQVAKEQPKKAK